MIQSFALLILAIIGLFLPVVAQHKPARPRTVEQTCVAQWRADQAANRGKRITQKAYMAQCQNAAVTAQAAASSSSSSGAATTGAAGPPTAAGARQFASAAEARSRCGTEAIVWASMRSKIYYPNGHRHGRSARRGAYMCEKDAQAEGLHAAKR